MTGTKILEQVPGGAVPLAKDGSLILGYEFPIGMAKSAHQDNDFTFPSMGDRTYLTPAGVLSIPQIAEKYAGKRIVLLPDSPLHWSQSIDPEPFGWDNVPLAE